MNLETLFSFSSLLVMPFWLLLIFLPRWRLTERVMAGPWVAVPAALLYAVLVLPRFVELFTAVLNPTLSGVTALLGDPAGAVIAWAHFLAFDLFVGRWVYLDGRSRGISAWITSPILFMVLMLGPIGFLLYLLARTVATRQFSADGRSAL